MSTIGSFLGFNQTTTTQTNTTDQKNEPPGQAKKAAEPEPTPTTPAAPTTLAAVEQTPSTREVVAEALVRSVEPTTADLQAERTGQEELSDARRAAEAAREGMVTQSFVQSVSDTAESFGAAADAAKMEEPKEPKEISASRSAQQAEAGYQDGRGASQNRFNPLERSA